MNPYEGDRFYNECIPSTPSYTILIGSRYSNPPNLFLNKTAACLQSLTHSSWSTEQKDVSSLNLTSLFTNNFFSITGTVDPSPLPYGDTMRFETKRECSNCGNIYSIQEHHCWRCGASSKQGHNVLVKGEIQW